MPSDDATWQQMQKNLVTGGVYHVLMPTGAREYCLWNGKQLVPCQVQNTEVQLNTVYMTLFNSSSDVSVSVAFKSDPQPCIYFPWKMAGGKMKQVLIVLSDIVSAKKCSHDGGHAILLIQPTARTCLSIMKAFGLSDIASKWKVAMLLKDVTQDQREVLSSFKHPTDGRGVFDTLAFPLLITAYAESAKNKKAAALGQKSRLPMSGQALPKFWSSLCDAVTSPPTIEDTSAAADDDDVIMTSTEVGTKCPYTQAVMKDPVRNKVCNHNYEKAAIHEFIARKKGNAKCPCAGCGNTKPLSLDDLEDNVQLKEHIERTKR